MGATASASLIVGIKIGLKSTKYTGTVTRFDPKNGSPVKKETPCFSIVLAPADPDKAIILPDDPEAFIDSHSSSAFAWEDWQRYRLEARLSDWFSQYDVLSHEYNDSGKAEGKLMYFIDRYYNPQELVLGLKIAGSSGSDSFQPFEAVFEAATVDASKKIRRIFPNAQVAWFLRSQLHG